jgi:membrane carboxypeptidase/penicillin-binding protein PbpC
MRIISAPFMFAAEICHAFNLFNFRDDLTACLAVTDAFRSRDISVDLLRVLIVAEDRRNSVHVGIDPISIVRATVHFIAFRKIEGASTIEQQFVRVVTGRYKRTIPRKLREQVLAIILARLRSKRHIASAYLQIAFYGKDLEQLLTNLDARLGTIGESKSIALVSRLKYPEPSFADRAWMARFERRSVYISMLLAPNADELQVVPSQILSVQ